jgi:hypothetical protein
VTESEPVTNLPQFAPSTNDPNAWSTDGVGWPPDELHRALKIALLYYNSEYDDVPDTTTYHELHVGETAGRWVVCDADGRLPKGGSVDEGTVTAVTWARLVPDPQEEDDPSEAETEPFGEQWQVYSEVADTRRRIHAELDGISVETGSWDDTANAGQFASAAGKVSVVAETIRRGDIDDGPARSVLRENLLTVAAVACGWIDTLDRT